MKFETKQLAVILVILWLCIVVYLGFSYVRNPPVTAQGTVVAINKTWQGGDLQEYENVTISFQGHTFHQILSCNYFAPGDSIEVTYYPPVWPTASAVSATDLPRGCDS